MRNSKIEQKEEQILEKLNRGGTSMRRASLESTPGCSKSLASLLDALAVITNVTTAHITEPTLKRAGKDSTSS